MDERHSGGGQVMAAAAGSPSLAWHHLPSLAPASAPAYAGFWRRFLASLIDGILLNFAYSFVLMALGFLIETFHEPDETPERRLSALVVGLSVLLGMFVLLNWLYVAVFEASSWQATLGKRALGMVVTDLTGSRITFGRASGRFFARYVSGLLLWLGYLIQPFTEKRQALHDMIAGTLVLRT